MNFSNQLKKYRNIHQLSQEALAEKIYVTRQTISKWENDKSYPDIHNLIALSVLFDISLDELVKGDVQVMKEQIDLTSVNKHAWIMFISLVFAGISIGPVFTQFGVYGLIIPFLLWLYGMISAIKLEKIKKKNNLKTYREIVAFMESKDNDYIESQRQYRNKKKDFWDKLKLVLIFSIGAGILAGLSMWLTLFFR